VTGAYGAPAGDPSTPWHWAAPMPPKPLEPVDWRAEGVTAVVGTLLLAVSGALAGLLWVAMSPKLSVARLAAGSDATFRAQVGADAWFIVATVLVSVVTAVALGLGGLAASFVADRVGFLDQRGSTTTALHALGAHVGGDVVAEIDFRVRALGVVAAGPLAALVVLGVFLAVDALRRH
jgi:hypothetical protein